LRVWSGGRGLPGTRLAAPIDTGDDPVRRPGRMNLAHRYRNPKRF